MFGYDHMNVNEAVFGGRSTWYTPLGTTVMLSATKSLRRAFQCSTALPGKWPPTLRP